jgi:hypothetical protein
VATAASDKPASPEETHSPRRRFWRRIPTPILVTFIGIALSAWLLPAFTRQWDDRQKAHELQAAIVTDMASATARMLTRGEERFARQRAKGLGRRQRAAANEGVRSIEWSQASLQLEARLHAYYPSATPPIRRKPAAEVDSTSLAPGDTWKPGDPWPCRSPCIVEAWQLYSYFVTWFDPTTRSPGRRSSYETAAANVAANTHRLDDHTRKEVGELIAMARVVNDKRADNDEPYNLLAFMVEESNKNLKLQKEVSDTFPITPGGANLAAQEGRLSVFEAHLSALETAIADQVLATDPKGYSTTTGDLLRDLIP